jgi:hypothetical protein
MFTTILGEVAGYFDRRALISAFFPNLFLWGLVVIIVIISQTGFTGAVKTWEELSGTAQGILLVAFFAWVSFWTFLTLNFRVALMRMYEGYGSEGGISYILFNWFFNWRTNYWKEHWSKLDSEDNNLENRQNDLRQLKLFLDNVYNSLNSTLINIEQAGNNHVSNKIVNSQPTDASIDNELKKTEYEVRTLMNNLPALTKVEDVQAKVLKWQRAIEAFLTTISENKERSWEKEYIDITNILSYFVEIIEKIKQEVNEVEGKRLKIHRDLFLYYPPNQSQIMPTQLGNVLKSAEMYTQERYCLDAVLIWSRLQPLVPKEFMDAVEDSKTSLDLMVTLSALVIFFGLPLSFYIAFITAISPFSGAIVFVGALSIVLFLSWLAYKNGVQAALAFGENIKTTFDLYRWNVLEALKLKLPESLDEERQMWTVLCEFLYRAQRPDERYYRYSNSTSREK